jgi:response regulator RpfG family c-di-GMP phosphodiesterase
MKKETILYVDDEEINLELFKATFEDDYTVIAVHSGEEGLDILKHINDINIIVSDVKMPEMNGFEFISQLKLFAPNKICIVLSAYMKSDFATQIKDDSYIYRYLYKPWRRLEVNRVILDAIDSYQTPENA